MRLSNWQQQLGVVCHSLLCAGCNNRLEPQQTPGSGKGKRGSALPSVLPASSSLPPLRDLLLAVGGSSGWCLLGLLTERELLLV